MTSSMTYREKLQKLRDVMADQAVDAYLVPRTDEYLGEYVAACSERLAWLTGFTGSAGLAIVMAYKAVVMSDGRYTIQLDAQVDGDLFERVDSQEVTAEDWLAGAITKGQVIGYDSQLHTPAQIDIFEKAGFSLKAVSDNLIDLIWMDRPAPPMSKVSLFPEKYAGVSAATKIKNVQTVLAKNKCDAVIITLSDSIAWLLNIRGNDIPFIPVCLSYLIVPAEGKAKWFLNLEKLSEDVKAALSSDVEFFSENALERNLQDFATQKIWYDPKRSSLWFKNILQEHGAILFEADDPVVLPRSCKNESEQGAMKSAHIRDGVAIAKFLHWFDTTKDPLDEIAVEKKLESFRRQADTFKEPSFSTIAGWAGNGAIVHYRADTETNKKITTDNLLLLDSGAQYVDGTTDITRTIAVGMPSEEMRVNNTLVLKGHIALASAVFSKGTTGKQIDELARQFLIEKGLNYSHGTGHGVGCYLSVHEEAASISPRGEQPLAAGMILSNEPGYYKAGEYGIRIENLVLVKEAADNKLCFETITLAPIDKRLIVVEMLSEQEKEWLNNYHAKVFQVISPLLEGESQKWLEKVTSPL